MSEAMTAELVRPDQAFEGNRLLSTLAAEVRDLIEPVGEMVRLKTGEIVLERGDQVGSSLFPVGPTIISMEVAL